MVDYAKLTVEETDDFEVSRGRSINNPIYPLFEQALADGKPRKIAGLNLAEVEGGTSEYVQVGRDAQNAAQTIKRTNAGKGVVKASVKKDVVNGKGVVRFKVEWQERYEVEKATENGVVTENPGSASSEEESGTPRRRARATT